MKVLKPEGKILNTCILDAGMMLLTHPPTNPSIIFGIAKEVYRHYGDNPFVAWCALWHLNISNHTKINSLTDVDLYEKAVKWFEENAEEYNNENV